MFSFRTRDRLAWTAFAASLLWTMLPAGQADAVTTVYTSRATFLAQLTTSDTDDFSASGYAHGDQNDQPDYDLHGDAHMNAVRGETIFTPTGWPTFNFILQASTNPWYCAGCNGSFRMTFTSTSQGGINGVFGAGFDSRYTSTNYVAFVTFGDGTTQETPLNGRAFFGITSDKLIRSIHVGLTGGGTTQSGNFEMDNLTIGNICGDGSPGGAEACDDGNANDTDCCHNDCTAYPAGTICGDQSVTTCSGADACDGAGVCATNDVPAGTAMAGCDDGNLCTFEQCNGSGACQNPAKSNFSSCADGDVCNGNEYCFSGTCQNGSPPNCVDYDPCTQDSCDPIAGCEFHVGPADTCMTGLKGKLQVKYDAETGEKSQLKWKLTGGDAFDQASLGDPTTTASFEICVYDENGGVSSLSSRLTIGPSVRFQSNDPAGYSFRDSLGFWDGIKTLKLKTGEGGKSSVTLAAKGTRVPLASPVSAEQYFAQDGRVSIQMHNTQTNQCWGSEFTEATKHTAAQFKAAAP